MPDVTPDWLLYLSLPLLLAPFLARTERVGSAAAQLILAGLALAAFRQGAGTLNPAELRTIAQQTPADAWFVGITAGAMLTGAALTTGFRDWSRFVLGAPLAVVLLWLSGSALVPLFVGGAIGCIPAILGGLSSRAFPPARSSSLAFALSLPVVALVGRWIALTIIPDATLHWQPLLSTALVAIGLAAAWRGQWNAVAATLMLLPATRTGTLALAVALLLACAPLVRRLLDSWQTPVADRIASLLAGVSVALLATVLLVDQVLLTVILAFGLAALAHRLVAPVPPSVHL